MKTLQQRKNTIDKNITSFFKTFFGIRTVKTALATAIALYIATQVDLKMPIMAGLSAIVTMKSSIFDSYTTSANRLLSTIVGGIIAGIFHVVGFIGFIPMMIGIVLVINICNYFRWKDSITLAVMVYVMVMLYEPSAPEFMPYWEYTLHRLFDTFVGLIIGLLINYFIFPPNRSEFIIMTYKNSIREMEDALISILQGQSHDLKNLVSDMNNITSELDQIIKDKKLGTKYNLRISKLVKMNSKIFAGVGIIAQFNDDGRIPILSLNNKIGINDYFKTEIQFDTENFPEEFESAFNYYLDDLLLILKELRESVRELSEEVQE